MVKEKKYVAYKEMQNIPVKNFNLKFKFHYDITESLINTQSKGGYSNRKKGRYRKFITITFDWIGIF